MTGACGSGDAAPGGERGGAPPTETFLPPTYGQGARIPWWAKIALKLILSILPIPYGLWSRLGLFRHGIMAESTGRVIDGFQIHVDHFRRLTGRAPVGVLELGPGDSVARALCVAAQGLGPCWLVDAGDYAVDEPGHYRAVAAALAARGLTPPVPAAEAGRAAVLAACGARYLTTGLAGLRQVPDGAVALILSDAVMEHLPLAEFDAFLAEMFRVLAPGGIASHAVDLADHLGGGLNHLRFPAWFWENPVVARAGFYTNRLRYPEILRRARAAGFAVDVPWIERWPHLPLPPRAMADEFRDCPATMLGIAVFGLILRKPG